METPEKNIVISQKETGQVEAFSDSVFALSGLLSRRVYAREEQDTS